MSQQLIPIYEPKFSDGSFGYRPGRSAKDAVQRIEEYAEQVYTKAVVLDLSKYFDTLNHELLVNILRRDVKDERVIQMIKRYLRSGVIGKRCSQVKDGKKGLEPNTGGNPLPATC